MEKYGLPLLGLFLALGLIIASCLASHSFERVKLASNAITVKGFAEKQVRSDAGVWRGSVNARAKTQSEAYKLIEASKAKLIVYLQHNGIPRDQINFSSVNSSTLNKNETTSSGEFITTNEIEYYQLSQYFSHSSYDVEKVARLGRESTQLIEQGVDISSYPPEFYISKLDDLKLELLGAATKNATDRAKTLAENSGSSVGNLVSANQGVFQITPPFSTDVSDYGSYDTSTIDKSVKAVVTTQFAVRK